MNALRNTVRAIVAVPLWLLLIVGCDPFLAASGIIQGPNIPAGIVYVAFLAFVAWLITGIPGYFRRQRQPRYSLRLWKGEDAPF